MRSVAKVTVRIPRRVLALVERAGRHAGKTRSAIVSEALESWLKTTSPGEVERKYVEGYLREPERVGVNAATARSAVLTWEPWE